MLNKKTKQQKLIINATRGIRFIEANITEDGSIVEIYVGSSEEQVRLATKFNYDLNEIFPIVRASQLKLSDKFLKHKPQTKAQERFKKSIVAGIKSGLTDFRHPIMDPSEDEDGIYFEKGNKPAVGHSASWWHEKVENFMVSKNSRIGLEKQYHAFMATLIKSLIEEHGIDINVAWKLICDDSRILGHYYDSSDAKLEFEPTGSRQIGKWSDLANTRKIIKRDDGAGLMLAGGYYYNSGKYFPLADTGIVRGISVIFDNGVAWIVMDV